MGTPVNQRVQKRRDALRAQGLRLVQRWVIDTRTPEFAAEARRESLILAEADKKNPEDLEFLDAAFADLAATMPDEED
jgi:hypothetical protein